MHDIITTLFTRSWLLALAGAAVIGAQSVSAQTAADSKHDRSASRVRRAHTFSARIRRASHDPESSHGRGE